MILSSQDAFAPLSFTLLKFLNYFILLKYGARNNFGLHVALVVRAIFFRAIPVAVRLTKLQHEVLLVVLRLVK